MGDRPSKIFTAPAMRSPGALLGALPAIARCSIGALLALLVLSWVDL